MNHFEQLDRLMERKMSEGLPYGGIVISKNHQEIYQKEYGTEGHNKRFFLYSCTKPMTMTAVMRLAEEGKICLDDPVEKYLPAYQHAFLLSDGQKKAPDRKMTLRHLCTMTGGLDYTLDAPAIVKAASMENADTVSVVQSFIEKPLDFEPGHHFQYSLCHDVMGAVVEKVTGQTLEQYLKTILFDPAGMKNTSFSYKDEEMAPQYNFNPSARTYDAYPIKNEYILCKNYYSGGAGCISTLEDLAIFTDIMACGGRTKDGKQILKPETIDLMRTEQLQKITEDPSFVSIEGPSYSYAVGVRRLMDKSQGEPFSLGEFGWSGAAGAYELCDPATGISFAFMIHVRNWPFIEKNWLQVLKKAVYAGLEESGAV